MTTFFGISETVSGHFPPRAWPFGRIRAHSSPRSYIQELFSYHPQVRERKQRHQIGRVLGQPSVLHLDVTELPLDDPKRVLYLCTDAVR